MRTRSSRERVVVGATVLAIVLVNKVVIQDRGSGWGLLLLVSLAAGLLLVVLLRAVERFTSRPRP